MTPSTPPSSPRCDTAGEDFSIVGVGASAGGLQALRQLLTCLPADTGMAFVIVQHLDPIHPSLLANVLAGETSMAVREAADGTRVQPNRVYVIPPAADLRVKQGVLALVARQQPGRLHLPIDAFFESLAEDQPGRAIGVVLSGSGSDGTEGLRAIKNAGGDHVRPGASVGAVSQHAGERTGRRGGRLSPLSFGDRPGTCSP